MLQAFAVPQAQQCDCASENYSGDIPDIFCWTKMGAEAGQPLASILHRKELERSAGGGTFAWGIGNSLGEAPELARQMSPSGDVDVLFTPMKSAPKAVDTNPSNLFLWVYFQQSSGQLSVLPEHMLVTSRGGNDKRTHYALLCKSEEPLRDQYDLGIFDMSGVRNLASMNPVGASQVTSIVRYCGSTATTEKGYRVSFRAKLYAEGFVKLAAPILMNEELTKLYEEVCSVNTEDAWRFGVRKLRDAAMALRQEHQPQNELLFA